MSEQTTSSLPPLTRRQALVLGVVESHGRATVPDLHAEIPGLAPSAIWKVCEALVRKGMITAEGDDDRRYLGGVHLRPARTTMATLQLRDAVLDWPSTLAVLLGFAGHSILVEIRIRGIEEPLTTIAAEGMWSTDELIVFLVDPTNEFAPDAMGSVSMPRAAFVAARVDGDAGNCVVEVELVGGASLVIHRLKPSRWA